jgi:hypothetical protein
MATDREFLGRGWRFPVAVNLTGGVSTSGYEENIRESIFVILGTAPGERLNRPQFGCRVHDLMFAPNNAVTAALAEHYCEEALYKFEPRIDDVDVSAKPNSSESNRLDIRISYFIAETNDERNIVYPFYLRQPDEEG